MRDAEGKRLIVSNTDEIVVDSMRDVERRNSSYHWQTRSDEWMVTRSRRGLGDRCHRSKQLLTNKEFIIISFFCLFLTTIISSSPSWPLLVFDTAIFAPSHHCLYLIQQFLRHPTFACI